MFVNSAAHSPGIQLWNFLQKYGNTARTMRLTFLRARYNIGPRLAPKTHDKS